MASRLSEQEAEARRASILEAARWCFLTFGFAKTTFDDIAKRAGISRTLLYRSFKNKEDVFTAVFIHWLGARHPAARAAAAGPDTPFDRLLGVCRAMVLEPWEDMVSAPMAAEFHDVCRRLDPELEAGHFAVLQECVTAVLGDEASAEVFVLALDGLLGDEPPPEVLEERVALLASHFAPTAEMERGR